MVDTDGVHLYYAASVRCPHGGGRRTRGAQRCSRRPPLQRLQHLREAILLCGRVGLRRQDRAGGLCMTHPHPFRFGLLGESVRSATELMETARRAEAASFATFLLRDHFIAEPFGHQLAPLAALATVAAVTERLRVGSPVLCNGSPQPVLLAKERATLDLVSGGRFELGLGAAFSRPEYEAAGLPYDPPGVRV